MNIRPVKNAVEADVTMYVAKGPVIATYYDIGDALIINFKESHPLWPRGIDLTLDDRDIHDMIENLQKILISRERDFDYAAAGATPRE